jgi:hypothetical protein
VSTSLHVICAIEVITTEDASTGARDRVLIRVVVSRPIGTAWDLVVDYPIAARIAVRTHGALGRRGPFFVVRQVNAHAVVEQAVGGT